MQKNHRWLILMGLTLIISGGCASTGNQTGNSAQEAAPNTQTTEFNIPIVVNKDVEWFIRYFQTRNRRYFKRWLSRSTRYIPMMEKILASHGLPTDLVYLAMIESGFNNKARSYRAAVGPWQFIGETGKRRDPIKATIAASGYLKDLYQMFDSWLLAAAGYNAGENKIKRAIKKHQTEDFWEMTNYRYLKQETKQYIPKLIAAALIAKNPEKYGFTDIKYQDVLAFDMVAIDMPMGLKKVAQMTGVSHREVVKLNPELKRWCTPPDRVSYDLRIPAGTKEQFLLAYEQMKPERGTLFQTHLIRSGDTLYDIARRYGTHVKPIMSLNRIVSPKSIRPGQRLIIPVPAKQES
jgi:membrane-bound lytic murein transglycosylase D